jgi:DNA-binding transcriptional MerR regulator
MRIGELAKATGISTRALRFYEERGLLSAKRAVNGYRTYDDSVVNRVANIRYLLDAGLTLDDIAQFRSCLDSDLPKSQVPPATLNVGWRRLATIDERISNLTRIRTYLAEILTTATTTPPPAQNPHPRNTNKAKTQPHSSHPNNAATPKSDHTRLG